MYHSNPFQELIKMQSLSRNIMQLILWKCLSSDLHYLEQPFEIPTPLFLNF